MVSQNKSGYPSIDKPWLRLYSEEILKKELPQMNAYEYLKQCNCDNMNELALDYEFVSITYREMFVKIDAVADSLEGVGIKAGDTITSCLPNVPEAIYLIYAAAKIGAKIDLVDLLTSTKLLSRYCDISKPKLDNM